MCSLFSNIWSWPAPFGEQLFDVGGLFLGNQRQPTEGEGERESEREREQRERRACPKPTFLAAQISLPKWGGGFLVVLLNICPTRKPNLRKQDTTLFLQRQFSEKVPKTRTDLAHFLLSVISQAPQPDAPAHANGLPGAQAGVLGCPG